MSYMEQVMSATEPQETLTQQLVREKKELAEKPIIRSIIAGKGISFIPSTIISEVRIGLNTEVEYARWMMRNRTKLTLTNK